MSSAVALRPLSLNSVLSLGHVELVKPAQHLDGLALIVVHILDDAAKNRILGEKSLRHGEARRRRLAKQVWHRLGVVGAHGNQQHAIGRLGTVRAGTLPPVSTLCTRSRTRREKPNSGIEHPCAASARTPAGSHPGAASPRARAYSPASMKRRAHRRLNQVYAVETRPRRPCPCRLMDGLEWRASSRARPGARRYPASTALMRAATSARSVASAESQGLDLVRVHVCRPRNRSRCRRRGSQRAAAPTRRRTGWCFLRDAYPQYRLCVVVHVVGHEQRDAGLAFLRALSRARELERLLLSAKEARRVVGVVEAHLTARGVASEHGCVWYTSSATVTGDGRPAAQEALCAGASCGARLSRVVWSPPGRRFPGGMRPRGRNGRRCRAGKGASCRAGKRTSRSVKRELRTKDLDEESLFGRSSPMAKLLPCADVVPGRG